jgi:hypothetical protein
VSTAQKIDRPKPTYVQIDQIGEWTIRWEEPHSQAQHEGRMHFQTTDGPFSNKDGDKPGLHLVFDSNPRSADYNPRYFNRCARALRAQQAYGPSADIEEHPRGLRNRTGDARPLRADHRVGQAAEFALAHRDGFTIPDLAKGLRCAVSAASRVRLDLEKLLAGGPLQLLDMSQEPPVGEGWVEIDDNPHHALHLYKLVGTRPAA